MIFSTLSSHLKGNGPPIQQAVDETASLNLYSTVLVILNPFNKVCHNTCRPHSNHSRQDLRANTMTALPDPNGWHKS